MSEVREPSLRAMDLLSESMRTLGANLIAFLTISVLCLLPSAIYLFYALPRTTTMNEVFYATLISSGLQLFLGFVAQGALVYGTVEYQAGHTASIGASLTKGLRSLVLVLAVAVVMGISVLGGMLLLLIPGFFIWMSLYISIPVAVAENTGVMESLQRSRELMMGSRLQVFGAAIVVIVCQQLATSLVTTLLSGAGGMVQLGGRFGVSLLFTALTSVMAAVAYVKLREAHDDVDAEELSRIFS